MAESIELLQTELPDRYRVESTVGVGGMATVYRAQDLKHNSPVAIKVLHSEVSALLGRQRFQREIEITRNLTHPFILPIHDSGVAGPYLFYVMPFVAETLRDLLRRDKKMPVETAVRIAQEVADAIDHAHRKGFVHRDLKPENILLEEDHAVVADFGLAKAFIDLGTTKSISEAENAIVTRSGVVVGTPTYMSPEQASGEQALDGRSDIYSLGCVLYEMIAGRPPYDGPNWQSVLNKQRSAAVPDVRVARPSTPADVSATINKALAKDPKDRFSTGREFHQSLASAPGPARPRRVAFYAVAATMVAAMAIGAPQLQQWWASWTGGTEIQSLAVLPLVDISRDPSRQYIADGIHAELISKIAQVGAPLRVVSWTTMSGYRDSKKSARQIARELGVDALVEGTIATDGGHVRITAMLIEAEADHERWSRSYDRQMSDVLLMQQEVAAEIAREIHGKLSAEQQKRAGKERTVDPDAFLVYVNGRHLWNERTLEGMRAALGQYQEAIAIDPTFASAHAGIADAYGALGMQGGIPLQEAHTRAKAAALKALELNESLADAHASLGNILQNYEWDWVQAEAEYRRAIELNPSSSTAHLWLALILAQRGLADLSLQEALLARELDPHSMPAATSVGVCQYFGRRYDESISSLLSARTVDSTYATLYRVLAGAYLQRGEEAKSVRAFETYFAVSGDSTAAVGIRRLYEAGGFDGAARALIAGSIERRQVMYVSPVRIAELYVVLGDNDEALRWLAVGYDEKDVDLNRLKADPIFDPLRSDPRFMEFLNRPLFERAWGTRRRG